jgi:ABC-2 type transport system permease protein
MNPQRVIALILRHTINLKHSYDRITDMFYWPAMDLFIWGITGLYLARFNPNSSHYLYIVLSGLVFWIVIWRAQYEISTNLLAELWDRNLINIFTSPITVWEWATSFIIFGFMKTIVSLSFSAALAFLLYQYNIFQFGAYLIPFIICLLFTGWAGGFFVAGFLIRYGNKIQTLAWAGIALLAPFSAVYYPLSILPTFVQKIGLFIPSTYIFEDIRQLLFTGSASVLYLLTGFILSIVYFVFSILFFKWMFEKSRKLGLGRLV